MPKELLQSALNWRMWTFLTIFRSLKTQLPQRLLQLLCSSRCRVLHSNTSKHKAALDFCGLSQHAVLPMCLSSTPPPPPPSSKLLGPSKLAVLMSPPALQQLHPSPKIPWPFLMTLSQSLSAVQNRQPHHQKPSSSMANLHLPQQHQ